MYETTLYMYDMFIMRRIDKCLCKSVKNVFHSNV